MMLLYYDLLVEGANVNEVIANTALYSTTPEGLNKLVQALNRQIAILTNLQKTLPKQSSQNSTNDKKIRILLY